MRLNEPAERTRPRTKPTREALQSPSSSGFAGLSTECSIHSRIGFILVTAMIMGSGFVQGKTVYDSVNRIHQDPPGSTLPSEGLAAATPTAAVATPFQFTTWRNSYAETDDAADSDYVIEQTTTVAAKIPDPGKSQDLESLSLQAAGTVGPKPSPEEPSRKNSFHQLGSQRVNALVPATMATKHSGSSTNTSSSSSASASSVSTPTEAGRNRSSPVYRNSAVKVDSKHPLFKGQKTDAPMLNYIFDTFSSANKHHHHDQRYGPHFEDVQRVGQATNLTVQAGSSIHLDCRISLLQDKTVSWVRHNTQEDDNALDLLTVGLHTYTGDIRYKMEFQYPNNWRLKITNVKKDDEALYECQISTHPPRVIQINLHVNAPKVMIVDEVGDPLQEKYYEIDSTLQLSCVVRNVAMTSSVVYWKHIDNTLNYDVTRGGVSVKTELMEDGANSTLSIAKISKTDSGNYTCSISDYQNFTIVVHILNGKDARSNLSDLRIYSRISFAGESFAELHHGGAGVVRTTLWHLALVLQLLQLVFLLMAGSRLSLGGEFS
ncbi:hypothetical protein KR009_009436 [Drosophila setifemur]|nr:hypothetical protein KR009_009436 [Drosophila setifemur]